MITSTLEVVAIATVDKTCSNNFTAKDGRTFPMTHNTFLPKGKTLRQFRPITIGQRIEINHF